MQSAPHDRAPVKQSVRVHQTFNMAHHMWNVDQSALWMEIVQIICLVLVRNVWILALGLVE